MGEFKQDMPSEIEQLKNQLQQVHLTQRDTSFKFSREQQVLKRLIASLTLKNGMVVQSIGFHRYLPVGTLGVCVENLNRFGVIK